MKSPDFGGWGGRYVLVRENTWLDPVPFEGYQYPEGRWYTRSAWGRKYMRDTYPDNQARMNEYFKPMARWTDAIQNDFSARADWCVKSYEDANHPPTVKLTNALKQTVKPGSTITLSAEGTTDPDGDNLNFKWWFYKEAGTYKGDIEIENAGQQNATFTVPGDTGNGETVHIICEVTDDGMPFLTRYQRVVVRVE
jgi:hypothetical protein